VILEFILIHAKNLFNMNDCWIKPF
jgi:hypothetical protein